MTKYIKIKTKEGLKHTDKQTTQTPIPHTKSVKVHEDSNLSVSTIQQKDLTSDCWLVQFEGFEACATCEQFLKSQCGGGETLTHAIRSLARGMSLNDQWHAAQYWIGYVPCEDGTKHDMLEHARKRLDDKTRKKVERLEKEKCFYNFVQWCKIFHVWSYALRKYRNEVKKQQQLLKEKEVTQTKAIIRLDEQFPYWEIREKAKRLFAESYHYIGTRWQQCSCKATTRKGAYRDEAYKLEDGTILYYYHQHAIVAKFPNGKFVLDSCEWRTITTKERINRYIPRNWRLYSKNYEWSLLKHHWNGNNWITDDRKNFYDGITIEA